jgi:hypothetical protein
MFSCAPLRDRLPRSLRPAPDKAKSSAPADLSAGAKARFRASTGRRRFRLASAPLLWPSAMHPLSSASLYYKPVLYTYAPPHYYLSASSCVPFAPSALPCAAPSAAASLCAAILVSPASAARPYSVSIRARTRSAIAAAHPAARAARMQADTRQRGTSAAHSLSSPYSAFLPL